MFSSLLSCFKALSHNILRTWDICSFLVCGLTFKATAMVMWRWLVNLTTLFSYASLNQAVNQNSVYILSLATSQNHNNQNKFTGACFGRHIVIALSVHPSVPLRLRCISPIFFEVGIPNLVCGCILWMTECRVPFSGHCDIDL